MCSEFGNWGLPYPKDLQDRKGEEPWWFETGHDWGDGVMYAHGVENRFTDWSLDRVFGDLRRFVTAAQWQQFRALKYQIEAMRRKPQLAGYVITELHDCHWESNGLLDMRRNPRVFHELFHIVNSDTVIVPKWDRLSYWSGDTARFEIAVAHGAGAAIEGAQLSIRLGDDERQLSLPRLEAPTVLDLGAIELRVPAMAEAGMRRAHVELRGANGRLIAHNHLDMAVHPARTGPRHGGERVWSPSRKILARLRALGYDAARRMEDATLVVSNTHNEAIAGHVRAGARLLLLPEAEGALHPFFPHWQNVKIRARAGSPWMGDWASSFAWLRRADHFAALPGGPLLDESFDRVIPDYVISGCNLLDFQARVFGGLVVGWIHKPVVLGVRALLRPWPHGGVDLPAVPGRADGRPDRDHAARPSGRARSGIAGGSGRGNGTRRGGRSVALLGRDLAVSRRERIEIARRVQGIEHRLADEAVAARLAVADRIP